MTSAERARSRTLLMQERSPGWPAWGHAVHLTGQCVMAYLLRLRVLRIAFNHATGGTIGWQRASAPYAALSGGPFDRALVEADALVALAGGAARWLFNPATVSAAHLAGDDRLADSFLSATPGDKFVIPHWREYLRQRALTMLSPPETQAVIACLAGRFVDRVKIKADDVYPAVDDSLADVRPRLAVEGHHRNSVQPFIDPRGHTVRHYVAKFGMFVFDRNVRELGIADRAASKLYYAGISTIGELLMRSKRDLSVIEGLGRAAIGDIAGHLAEWAYVLAPSSPQPDPAAPPWFSAAYVYRREAGEEIYKPSHNPRFYRV